MAEGEQPSEAAWTRALALDELWEGEMLAVSLGGTELLLVRLGPDEVHAYSNRCPHASSPLHEGVLHGNTLRCAYHHWLFDARTGSGINPQNCRLRRYPLRIIDGVVLVQLQPAA